MIVEECSFIIHLYVSAFTMPNKSLIGTHQTATIAKEFLDSGNSPTAEALNKTTPASTTSGIGPKNQLLYLSELLGFEVIYL